MLASPPSPTSSTTSTGTEMLFCSSASPSPRHRRRPSRSSTSLRRMSTVAGWLPRSGWPPRRSASSRWSTTTSPRSSRMRCSQRCGTSTRSPWRQRRHTTPGTSAARFGSAPTTTCSGRRRPTGATRCSWRWRRRGLRRRRSRRRAGAWLRSTPRRLGEWLFELLSEALGLPAGYLGLDAGCKDGLGGATNYYRPCPELEATMGTTRQSDPSFLTVLLQDTSGGGFCFFRRLLLHCCICSTIARWTERLSCCCCGNISTTMSKMSFAKL
ncbi:hypothetical protein EE612_044049 [Oryza sativa]|nr:hypothetical protein EE612_044049 [Oryza sativa]